MASVQALPDSGGHSSHRSAWITVQVLSVTSVARDTITLALAVPGTRHSPAAYRPGQFITLAFPGARSTFYRSYSLCGGGEADNPWEITVKRQNAGIVSSYIYTHVRPGMLLQASLPQGRFTLPATLQPGIPIVFVAAGTGVTPIFSMLRALAQLDPALRPRIYLHYAYHHPDDAIYGSELAALDPQRHWLTQWHYVTTSGHRLGVEQVLAPIGNSAAAAEWYICGPASLKRNLESALQNRGVSRSHIHTEIFSTPAVDNPGGSPSIVRLADSGISLHAQPGEVLLQTLERYGYRPDFNCRVGECGTCRLRLLSGQVHPGDGNGLTAAERGAGYVLSCVARPGGDIVLASAGLSVAGYANSAPGRIALLRKRARQRLRIALVAATVGLFITAWGFTNHVPGAQSSSSNSSSPSSPGLSPATNGNGGSSSSQSGQFGPGSITTQPNQTLPNTSTGVS
jgi:ferredoxin-NADP reductase